VLLGCNLNAFAAGLSSQDARNCEVKPLTPLPHSYLIAPSYSWGTPIGSEQRSKVAFSIMQGPLNGHAVAVVESKGACQGYSPAMPPSHGGSQAFIFHAKVRETAGRLCYSHLDGSPAA